MADELRIHSRPELERPVLVAAFRGWNDGAQAASLAAGYLAKTWGAERFADVDPGELLRLPGDAAARLARGRADAPDRLARDGLLPRAAGGARPRHRAPARDRAEPPLAHVHRSRRRARAANSEVELMITLGALLADVPHTRLGTGHGQRYRRGAGPAARALGLALRGADRDRRRPPRRLPSERHPLGEPLGGGPALRLADAQPARRAGALRAARQPARRSRSTRTSSRRRRRTTRSRSARPSPRTRRRPPTSRSSSAAPDRSRTSSDLPSGDALAAELTRFLRERDEEDGKARERCAPTQ